MNKNATEFLISYYIFTHAKKKYNIVSAFGVNSFQLPSSPAHRFQFAINHCQIFNYNTDFCL